jgi:hypothetical protein
MPCVDRGRHVTKIYLRCARSDAEASNPRKDVAFRTCMRTRAKLYILRLDTFVCSSFERILDVGCLHIRFDWCTRRGRLRPCRVKERRFPTCPLPRSVCTGGKRGFHSTHMSRTKFDPRPMGSSVPVYLKMWAREH